jgi:hypothetical protein
LGKSASGQMAPEGPARRRQFAAFSGIEATTTRTNLALSQAGANRAAHPARTVKLNTGTSINRGVQTDGKGVHCSGRFRDTDQLPGPARLAPVTD